MYLFQSQRNKIHLPRTRLTIAVSGGVDSMFLLGCCLSHPLPVSAAHVNYQKRGEESDRDEKMVREYCLENGIPFFSVKAPEFAETSNFQKEARRFRYQFFEKVRKTSGAEFVLTAHHFDDELETLLFRFFRDKNPETLTGIPERRGRIYRPMLLLRRSEILQAAKEAGLPWREDASNLENDFTRNRIRNEVIPRLNKENPEWERELLELRTRARYVRDLAAAELEKARTKKDLELALLLNASPELRKLLLRIWLNRDYNVYVSRNWLDDTAETLPQLQTGSRIQISESEYLLRDRTVLRYINFDEQDELNTSVKAEIALNQLPFVAERLHGKPQLQAGTWAGKPEKSRTALELSFSKLTFPLLLRPWEAGDAIQPLGLKGHKNISDLLTDIKVPSSQKQKIPVLETFDGKLAAVIFSRNHGMPPGVIASAFSCATDGEKTLRITLKEQR